MSTWHARCSIHFVGTLCWADGATTVPETVSSWLQTTSMPLSTSSRSATGWSPSSWEVLSSEVQFDHPSPPFFSIRLSELTSISLHHRNVLPAARGGGHHGGCGGGRCMLLLWAGPLASHVVVQRGLQPALAGLGGDGHQVPVGGLQHQWKQRRYHAASLRPPKAAHHLLPEGKLQLQSKTHRRWVCLCSDALHNSFHILQMI